MSALKSVSLLTRKRHAETFLSNLPTHLGVMLIFLHIPIFFPLPLYLLNYQQERLARSLDCTWFSVSSRVVVIVLIGQYTVCVFLHACCIDCVFVRKSCIRPHTGPHTFPTVAVIHKLCRNESLSSCHRNAICNSNAENGGCESS